MNRAYSLLDIKAVDEETGTITGIASTPSPDRMADIVLPQGAVFKLPIPLLWQHDARTPIGQVTEATVTAAGIEIVATIAKGLSDEINRAWTLIKAGLVRGLSIGFRELEYEPIPNSWGVVFTSWEWLELSAVTIPANAEASITSIKQFDTGAPAATGQQRPGENPAPGASGGAKAVKAHTPKAPKEGTKVKKSVAEQISAFEATRQAKAARMEELMGAAAETGETLDAEASEEYDTLAGEVKSIDTHLKRLSDLEQASAARATPVNVGQVRSFEDGAAARSGVQVKAQPKLAPGIALARLAKVKAVSRLDSRDEVRVAERLYGPDSDVYAIVKANEVTAGSNVSGNWAADLTSAEGAMYADFAAFLRPATILGKFGQNGVPDLRRVPFREPLISQTGGGAGYWVGEGKPKPLTSFDFDRTTLTPLKVANITVLTEENIRSSSPSSEMIVRDALRDALAATQDSTFIDPTNGGTSNVKPAAITYGAPAVASTGTDGDAVRLDVRALFQKFIDADNPPENGVWIMSTTNALALSLMLNALGQREFPNISMTGGTFEGLPVIASRYASTYVSLVNASDVYEADDGEVAVDMSREASLEMKSASLSQDATAGTGASLVSMFQNNLVALRAEKTINWKLRRASAVAYLSGVAWGGAVPAS